MLKLLLSIASLLLDDGVEIAVPRSTIEGRALTEDGDVAKGILIVGAKIDGDVLGVIPDGAGIKGCNSKPVAFT